MIKKFLLWLVVCVISLAYSLWVVTPLVRLAKITVSHTPMYWQLICLLAFAALHIVATGLSVFDGKPNAVQVASGVFFYVGLCSMDMVLWGIIGLVIVAATCGGRVPAHYLLMMIVFNCTGWSWFGGSRSVDQPARIQENFTYKENNFLFMLKQVANLVLPKIDINSWGKTFTQNTRVEFSSGPVMNIKAGTDFKVTEINKGSYGSSYKIDSSKPVSFGVGVAQVKFKTATLEVSNNYQTKITGGDFIGNKWLMKYIYGNTFDLRF
jgi:hypothetical protein